MELWDTYDEFFNKLNLQPLIRGEEIPNGVFHVVCEALVKHTDGSFLIMQRDYRKHLGGMWEATAGGSALLGESPQECVMRELLEETGITPFLINQVDTVINKPRHTIYCEFTCVTDIDKDAVRLSEGETVDYKWVSREELSAMTECELASTRTKKYTDRL